MAAFTRESRAVHEVCIARFSFGYIYVKRPLHTSRVSVFIYIKIPRIARLAYGEQRATVKGVGDRFRERLLHISHVSVFIYIKIPGIAGIAKAS